MKLFEPITIRKTVFKNRIFMSGMGTGLGIRNENSRRHYEERARGGAGAIVIAGMMPDALMNDIFIRQFYNWVGAPVQQYGTKVGPQLWYGNQYPSFLGKGVLPEYVAPSAGFPLGARPMLSFFNDTQCYCRELTIFEIKDIIKTYATAAAKTKEIGFDFVEMHGCHGHNLCHQFFFAIGQQEDGRIWWGSAWQDAFQSGTGPSYPRSDWGRLPLFLAALC